MPVHSFTVGGPVNSDDSRGTSTYPTRITEHNQTHSWYEACWKYAYPEAMIELEPYSEAHNHYISRL